MTEFRITGEQGGIVEAVIKPEEPKEAAMWLLYLLSHDNFVVKYNLKRNNSGKVKVKIYFAKKQGYQQIIADTQLKIAKLLNKG